MARLGHPPRSRGAVVFGGADVLGTTLKGQQRGTSARIKSMSGGVSITLCPRSGPGRSGVGHDYPDARRAMRLATRLAPSANSSASGSTGQRRRGPDQPGLVRFGLHQWGRHPGRRRPDRRRAVGLAASALSSPFVGGRSIPAPRSPRLGEYNRAGPRCGRRRRRTRTRRRTACSSG